MRDILFFAFATVLCLPAAVHARAPVVLAPVKPWNLHYAENSCQLFRSFGTAEKPTMLVLESAGLDSSMTMMVHGPALSSRTGRGKAKASFVPSTGRSFDSGEVTETTKGGVAAIYWGGVDLLPDGQSPVAKTPERIRDLTKSAELRALKQSAAARITALEITEPNKRVTVLQTGSLAKVNAMLRDCNREQMAAWGLDPAVQDKIVLNATSKQTLASLFDDNDYPMLALANGQMSIVVARLIVGADGNVKGCTSLTPFVGEGFKEVVCNRLYKAKFEPAELEDGTRVPTFVMGRINFRIPS